MRIIVFDLDDTLYSTYAPFETAFMECFPGYSNMERHIACKAMRSYSESLLELRTQGLVSPEELYAGRMEAALKSVGGTATPKEALVFQNYYENAQKNIQLLPGMGAVLNQARGSALLSILTNGPSEGQRRKLEALQMNRWVIEHNVFVSEEIGVCKPDPEIFAHLEEKMGAIPERTLMIGDSLTADMAGAAAMGWDTLWFNWQNKDCTEEVSFNAEVNSVEALSKEISQWVNRNQYSSLLATSGYCR